MVNSVALSYRTYLAMDDNEGTTTTGTKRPGPDRIRFQIQDEEAAAASGTKRGGTATTGKDSSIKRPILARSSTGISEDSISLRPGSRQGIEPAAILPIQYRTL